MTAVALAQLACGAFFLTGLVTGVWKYQGMIRSADGAAPVYVDICHRASLMYAFACLVLLEFARRSAWPDTVDLVAVSVTVGFFALAVGSYALHAVLNDTDNQMRRPHTLGHGGLPAVLMNGFVYALAAGEIAGFVTLFTGSLATLR